MLQPLLSIFESMGDIWSNNRCSIYSKLLLFDSTFNGGRRLSEGGRLLNKKTEINTDFKVIGQAFLKFTSNVFNFRSRQTSEVK